MFGAGSRPKAKRRKRRSGMAALVPKVAAAAAHNALRAINVLRADMATGGTQRRQRFLLERIRSDLDTIDFLIGYEAIEREHRAAA